MIGSAISAASKHVVASRQEQPYGGNDKAAKRRPQLHRGYAGLAFVVALSGATGTGLLMGILGAAIMMIALGRPYDAFLNGVRHLFGLPPGGKKPMSLNN
jgi:hypothetical protein